LKSTPHWGVRLKILIDDDIARNEKLAGLGEVDNTAGRKLGRAKVDAHGTTVSEVTVAGAFGPGEGDTS